MWIFLCLQMTYFSQYVHNSDTRLLSIVSSQTGKNPAAPCTHSNARDETSASNQTSKPHSPLLLNAMSRAAQNRHVFSASSTVISTVMIICDRSYLASGIALHRMPPACSRPLFIAITNGLTGNWLAWRNFWHMSSIVPLACSGLFVLSARENLAKSSVFGPAVGIVCATGDSLISFLARILTAESNAGMKMHSVRRSVNWKHWICSM